MRLPLKPVNFGNPLHVKSVFFMLRKCIAFIMVLCKNRGTSLDEQRNKFGCLVFSIHSVYNNPSNVD